MKRGALIHSRRGLSPLIATVLLIAFAVALGVMVMNWGKSAGAKVTPSCQDVTLNPQTVNAAQFLCFDPASYNLRPESTEYQLCVKNTEKK